MAKILVIEDEQSIRDTVQDILELEGFEALGAENGKQGIQLAKQFSPDLIICDVMMPEIDGYGVLKMLHQDAGTATIPFIFLTAQGDRSSVRQGMNLGADDYLTKPFTPQELLEVLSVRLKKSTDQLQPLTHKVNDLTAKLDYQTYHDPLTHLPNFLGLKKSFEELRTISDRDHRLIPVLHLNLEKLSHIRAALGQDVYYCLLEEVSSRLISIDCVDSVSYVSSEHLTVLVYPLTNVHDVELIAKNISELFSSPFFVHQHELFLTCRIGIACYPQHGECIEELLSNAEVALTTSTKPKNNSINLYTIHQQICMVNHFEIETELYHALERDQLEVYYQPQFDLQTKQLIGAEALIRWFHPRQGMISPLTFIPIAEETGLIDLIGEWVLRTACAQTKVWQKYRPDLQIAINLSSTQFAHPQLLSTILEVLTDVELAPSCLELEITESNLIRDSQLALKLLNVFRQHNIKIAIDDFGVGYSSFKYLQQFSLDTLKIDSCFIRNLEGSFKNQKIVSSIIQMAHAMNLKVIAEGVEQQSEFHVLRQLQCDFAQGYWFSEARSKQDFEREFIGS